MIRIALLDLNAGYPNQGMRCLREIITQWSEYYNLQMQFDEFEVRIKNQIPDLTYDIYLSSGGPGSPFDGIDTEWETQYFNWLQSVEDWNNNPDNNNKKFIFLICHSFQLACRYYNIATVCERKSTSFGVFPVHVLLEGQHDPVFHGMPDPFYVVDSRDWQVIGPDFDTLKMRGSTILCIEKYRPHVPYQQAIMGLRFNEYMVGTQFHPEADARGMSIHLQTEEKKQTVIKNFGEAKWQSMIEQLNDPDKIMWTHTHVLPNFLNKAIEQFQLAAVSA